ncbi:proline iminopeptidase-family hydrolase [Myxococcus virescens]|uniref:proline iminopeptidase-family hydrolase n=1 Tax=Myxococcus virescens TaxID=83456 RepID=UPI003DA35086
MSTELPRSTPTTVNVPGTHDFQGAATGRCPVEGGEIWYEVLNASAVRPPLLVVHGGPGTPHGYLRSLAALVPEHPVIVYDQLGCGRSDQPKDASLWRLERFVAELEALVRRLRLDAFHLLAHSAGTMLACDYALANPRTLLSLTMLSPVLSARQHQLEMKQLLERLPADVSSHLMMALNGGTVASIDYLEATLHFSEQYMCRMSPWPDALMEVSSHTNASVRDSLWGKTEFRITGSLRDYERLDRLPSLTVPSLLICGQHDFTTPRLCRRYSEAMANAELVVIDNASHMAHLEQPRRFANVLNPFLQRVEKSSRPDSPPGA